MTPSCERRSLFVPAQDAKRTTPTAWGSQSTPKRDTVSAVPRDPLNPTGTAHPDLLDLELAEPRTEPIGVPPSPAPAGNPQVSTQNHPFGPAAVTSHDAPRYPVGFPVDQLDDATAALVARVEMVFVATADARGECDATLRTGPAGFIQVLDRRRIAYPERGDNLDGNPRVGIMIVDVGPDPVALQVTGRARIVEDAELRAERPGLPTDRTPRRWVVLELEQAYLHGRARRLPRMPAVPPGLRPKGGDHFAGQIPIESASAVSGR